MMHSIVEKTRAKKHTALPQGLKPRQNHKPNGKWLWMMRGSWLSQWWDKSGWWGGVCCPNDGTKVHDDWELVVPMMGQRWMMIGSWLSQWWDKSVWWLGVGCPN